MIENLLIGAGVLFVLLFIVWVLWTYHKSGKLRDISGIISAIAMVACLPLAGKLVSERTSFLSQASAEPQVVQVQVQTLNSSTKVVYLTLSEAAFAYLELPDEANETRILMSTGKVEQRIGHSFVINVKNRDQFEAKIYVNGKRDKQTVKI